MADLSGAPSDSVPAILATGRTDVTTVFVSMSGRHPQGRDADYIEWHGVDHQPEQHRLLSLRASLRLVSTPACRASRAASDERYDGVDHVMTYFFAGDDDLSTFNDLNVALTNATRNPYVAGKVVDNGIPGLPSIERGPYHLEEVVAAPRVKVGGDVLPWRPARGVYLLIEAGLGPVADLLGVPGVAGAWRASGMDVPFPYATADLNGLQLSYLFLDGDPATTAGLLRPALEKRWYASGATPLLAAAFHTVRPHEWDRYLP